MPRETFADFVDLVMPELPDVAVSDARRHAEQEPSGSRRGSRLVGRNDRESGQAKNFGGAYGGNSRCGRSSLGGLSQTHGFPMKKTPVGGTGASGSRRSSRGNCDRSPYHSKHQRGPAVHTRRAIIHNLSDRQWIGCRAGAGAPIGLAPTPAQLPRHSARGTGSSHDSLLEETVSSELVSEAGVATDEFLESIKKGSRPSVS